MFNKDKKNISLEIILDDDFNGIMHGIPEESVGCKLKGKVVLDNKSPISAKHLLFGFLGKITVACGPPMSSTRPEYSEIKTIYRKECLFHDSTMSSKRISAGTHEYHFDIDLPGCLPSSFKGSRGKIEYYCVANLARPLFRNNILVKKIVNIKRCLMDELRVNQAHHTLTEGILGEKVHYQISSPIMTFSEGGLVHSEIILKSTDPDTVIRTIEYGLKEQVHYHTSGEDAMTVIANVNEDRYPLGRTRLNIEQSDGSPIPINFRLCPWVNYDLDSQLIDIHHKLTFTVCVSEMVKIENERSISFETPRNNRRFSAPVPSRSRRRADRTASLSLPSYIFNNNYNNNNSTFNRILSNNNDNDDNNYNSRRISRSSRNSTFSITNLMRTTNVDVERKKHLSLEIPIIITAKSTRPQQSPPYIFDDRPPAYIIASMIPPPPAYNFNY